VTQDTSGDLIADRRIFYAAAALNEGDFTAAADLAEQALERAPTFAPAWFLLGEARQAQAAAEPPSREAAVAAFRRALALDPADRLGARLRLALLGADEPEEAMSAAYVRRLFDEYAPRFDRHLVDDLGYRAPELILEAVHRHCAERGRPFRFRRLLDLGCGTGLVGRVFAKRAERIEGVDLSPRMLGVAARTKAYARLVEGDVEAFLTAEEPASADLVVAADVLVYIARLDGLVLQVARVLEPGALAAVTLQTHEGEGVRLGEDQRYAHSEQEVRRVIQAAGLSLLRLDPVSTRQERGRPVPGLLAIFGR
jgi:predicted TPR repeat methyltransferase